MSIVPAKAKNKLLDLILAAVFCHGESGENKVRSKCSLFNVKIIKNRSKRNKECFKTQGREKHNMTKQYCSNNMV